MLKMAFAFLALKMSAVRATTVTLQVKSYRKLSRALTNCSKTYKMPVECDLEKKFHNDSWCSTVACGTCVTHANTAKFQAKGFL